MSIEAKGTETGMDVFLLKKQQVFHSLESITFTWSIIIATVIIAIYGFNKYRRLKTDVFMQMKTFNVSCFTKDRLIFEGYGEKRELEGKDFRRILNDKEFREHLWRQEINYYNEIVRIVENLKLLRFYEFLAAILFLVLYP